MNEGVKTLSPKTVDKKKKIGSTDFLIRVQFRQHATWQGEIQWLGVKHERRRFFRSFLEMVMLIQEALEKEGKIEPSITLQNWDEIKETLLETKPAE